MSRHARKSDPALRRPERIELNQGNLSLRLIGLGIAILVAVLAFTYGVTSLLGTETGWQQISPVGNKISIAQGFILSYEIGKTEQDAGAEMKGLSAVYSEALKHSSQVLSTQEFEDTANLYTLNTQPGQPVTVDPLLYEAFQEIEASGSRLPYLAPVFGQYVNLFTSGYDEAAVEFDPDRSTEAAQYVAEIAAFAANPDQVQVKLLPDCELILEVSPEYLAYAAENGITQFVDLGMLFNAFVCDAVADALVERGYTNGFLSSYDGYSRILCAQEFGLNVFDRAEDKPVQLAVAKYTGPAAIVSCRSFPILEKDQMNYYTYSDGTVRGPYLNEAGLPRAASTSLSVGAEQGKAAELALRTLAAYAGEDPTFAVLSDLSWVSAQNGEVSTNGALFQVEKTAE